MAGYQAESLIYESASDDNAQIENPADTILAIKYL